MNKQELIEKLEARHVCDLAVSDSFKNGFNTMKGIAVDLASELDEPIEPQAEKVEVPSIIAKFIKENSDPIFEICAWSDHYGSDGRTCGDPELSIVLDWYGSNTKEFYEAVLNGYTVKQEPKYYILLPKLGEGNGVRLWKDNTGVIYTSGLSYLSVEEKSRFTEQEIKSIDERYWAFAVPVDGSVKKV